MLLSDHPSLYDALPSAILISDLDSGQILDCNSAAERLLGMSKNSILALKQSQLHATNGTGRYQERVAECLRTGTLISYEALLSMGGQSTPVLINMSVAKIGEGHVAIQVVTEIITRRGLLEELGRQADYYRILDRIATTVGQSLDLKEVLDSALEKTLSLLEVEAGLIYLLDRRSRTFSPVVHRGLSEGVLRGLSEFKVGEGLSGHVAQECEPLLVPEVSEDPRNVSGSSSTDQVHSYVGVPVKARGEVMGVMVLVSQQKDRFRAEHIDLLQRIGGHIGIAIDNACLYEETQQELAEIKSAEEALRESEEKYRTLVENSLEGIIVLKPYRILFANNALAKILGYSVEELLLLGPGEVRGLVHPEDQEIVWGRHQDRFEGKAALAHYEFRVIRKDGMERWVETSATRVEYLGELAVQATYIDITERRKAEEALRKSEEQYCLLAQNATDVIYTLNMDQQVTYVSPSISRLLGYSPEEASTKTIQEILTPDSYRSQLKAMKRSLDTEDFTEPATLQLEAIHRDGSIHDVEVSARFLLDEGGTPSGILGICRDITERKRVERR